MNETYDLICERIPFTRKDEFMKLITRTIYTSSDTSKSTYAIHDNVLFKLSEFLKGFSPFNNELGKGNSYEAAVQALMIIFEELGVDIEKEECFILFHIKDLGKFRMREEKLFKELTELWHKHNDYKLSDNEFSRALKNMMRIGVIDYRRANLQLKPSFLIRYRTRKLNERF